MDVISDNKHGYCLCCVFAQQTNNQTSCLQFVYGNNAAYTQQTSECVYSALRSVIATKLANSVSETGVITILQRTWYYSRLNLSSQLQAHLILKVFNCIRFLKEVNC